MRTSPSQIVNFLACDRKWWFRTIHKLLDGKDPAARDTGTVLHEVAGRWLNADDQGRDRAGLPVDLYPPGWERVREFGRDTGRSIDKQQQAIVRVMIQKAIENGTLRRLPGREVERHIEIDLIPGVTMQGYIDQDAPAIVEDHKTTKNAGYALNAKKLAQDEKMLCYAVMKADKEGPAKDGTILRLNYFDKSNQKEPWPVDTCVKPERVVNFRDETLIPAATRMLALQEANLPVERWDEVAGPNRKGACDDYGGCPYAEICTRTTTIERHLKRHTKQPKPLKEKKTMSYFKKRPKTETPAQPEQPVSTPAPAVSTPTPAPVNPAPVTPADVPPWAVPSCRACNGKGINSKGAPCRACDLVMGRTGGPTSSQYETWVDDGGILRWKPAGGAKIVPEPKAKKTAKAPETPKADVKPEKPPEAPTPSKDDKKEHFTPLPVGVEIPVTMRIEPPEPKAGFDLFIGCVPLGQPRIDLSSVLAEEGHKMAVENQKASYYDLDAFARRDKLAANAHVIAAELCKLSVGPGLRCALLAPVDPTPDERSLLVALRPFARSVTIRA